MGHPTEAAAMTMAAYEPLEVVYMTNTEGTANKYYKVEFFEEDLWGVTFGARGKGKKPSLHPTAKSLDEQEGIWPEGKDKTKDGSDKGPKVFTEGTVEEWNGRYAFRSESAAAARKAVDKLLKSKKKKGYVEDDEPEE